MNIMGNRKVVPLATEAMWKLFIAKIQLLFEIQMFWTMRIN